MILEYLFLSIENKESVKNIETGEASLKIIEIEDGECWIAQYEMKGENERTAKMLSKINHNIIENFNPIVLLNECSAYFNESLFPLVNSFERKLRKLLYIAQSLTNEPKVKEKIYDLESKDLGAIFTILFSDENFVRSVRTKVKETSWQFTKSEILRSIDGIGETSIWDILFSRDKIKELIDNFDKVKNYRNDVMHAHNMDVDNYNRAKKLFSSINESLTKEIENLTRGTGGDDSRKYEDLGEKLNTAMDLSRLNSIFQEKMKQYSKFKYNLNPEILEEIQLFAELLKSSNQNLWSSSKEILKPMGDSTDEND